MHLTPEIVSIIGLAAALVGLLVGYGIREGTQSRMLKDHDRQLTSLDKGLKDCAVKFEDSVDRIADIQASFRDKVLDRLDVGSRTLGRLEASVEDLKGRMSRVESVLNGKLKST